MKNHANFEHSFAQELPEFVLPANASDFPEPKMVLWNDELARELNLSSLENDAQIWVGNEIPEGASRMAMGYSGHQFGGFSPRLGDGRAWLMGEIFEEAKRTDIHLKGIGATPFSRPNTDGRSALGPALREYIMGEAMHALGIPTSRGLAVALTGEKVFRNGMKAGAVFTRVASSHIRVGTFQFAAMSQDFETIRKLADYTISRHYPEIKNAENPYLTFLYSVCNKQAFLIAKWMSVGFVHGVMNTDNMAISGETIDYGPCAFMESYDPQTVFSSIDTQGRYSYGNQPILAQWNLARFAESLLPLLDKNQDEALALAETVIQDFAEQYSKYWQNIMTKKIGLENYNENIFKELNRILTKSKVDFTLFFRNLAHQSEFESMFSDREDALAWRKEWLKLNPDFEMMDKVNPIYIPRNQRVEEAIQIAENELDFRPVKNLISVLKSPFEKQEGHEKYAVPAEKNFGPFVTYCGT